MPQVAQAVSGDRAGGDRSRHAADPQPGHGRRQPQSAAALLVLPQRGVRLLQEGREPRASRLRARTSSTRSSAAARASSSIRRAWRCRAVAYGATFRLVGPKGERLVPAAEYFTMPTLQNVKRRERARAGRAPDARHPAGARARSRAGTTRSATRTSHDWPIAFATVAAGDERRSPCVRRAIVMGAVAPVPWRSQAAEAGAGRQADHRSRRRRPRPRPRCGMRAPLSQNAYKIQVAKTAVKRAILQRRRHHGQPEAGARTMESLTSPKITVGRALPALRTKSMYVAVDSGPGRGDVL